MWKYARWILVFAIGFYMGRSHGIRSSKPVIVWRNCEDELKREGVLTEAWR